MSFRHGSGLYPHAQSTTRKENTMPITYTFDVFSSLDGYGSYSELGDWGGYWGKQGPEFLDHRLTVYREEQRMVLGANTFQQFVQLMGPSTGELKELDPVNTQMRNIPTTVVSTTIKGPLDWPDAVLVSGDASTSSPGSRRSPTSR